MIGEEEWVDCVEMTLCTRHVKLLRVAEVADVVCEGPPAINKRVGCIFVAGIIVILLEFAPGFRTCQC
jgi:hypothetical protein